MATVNKDGVAIIFTCEPSCAQPDAIRRLLLPYDDRATGQNTPSTGAFAAEGDGRWTRNGPEADQRGAGGQPIVVTQYGAAARAHFSSSVFMEAQRSRALNQVQTPTTLLRPTGVPRWEAACTPSTSSPVGRLLPPYGTKSKTSSQ